jgi:hypothetical protein
MKLCINCSAFEAQGRRYQTEEKVFVLLMSGRKLIGELGCFILGPMKGRK